MATSNQGERVASEGAQGRTERLFQPPRGSREKLGFALGMLGCFAIGAGFYGAALAAEAVAGSGIALGAGAACILVSVLLAFRRGPGPVRVGELGVIYGDPSEVPRLRWCDVRRLRLSADALELEPKEGRTLRVPLPAHGAAAARILAEASQRIGDRVDVSPKAHERLPSLSDGDAERVATVQVQFTGRKCAASGKSITFDSDARLCESCAALYHAQSVPDVCESCGRPLASAAELRARAAAS